MEWFFEQFSQMGGAGAGAYRNSLAGAGVPPTELFVREVIQNSVDATRTGYVTKVRFRELEYSVEDLQRLRGLLALDHHEAPVHRANLIGEADWWQTLSDHPRALLVEDFGTVGLGGTLSPSIPGSKEDNFRRLVLEVGVTSEAEGRGGTFGYGKGVYWASSRAWTVIFYSRFDASPRTDGDSSRLIGVSWFNEHNWSEVDGPETRFTGRAWLGVGRDGACYPLTNEAADGMAAQFGFTPRGPGETGTSALILGHQMDLGKLSQAIELNWWPRYIRDRLRVQLPDGSAPSPLSNEDLRPYARAFALATGAVEPSNEEASSSLTYRNRQLGRLGIVLTEPESAIASRIALIRSPGMVVDYYEGLQLKEPPYASVFLADAEMDGVLAASEPPAHDRWDHNTIRQDRELSDRERQDIKKLLEKVRSTARAFVTEHREPPPEPPPNCRVLEKLFGEVLTPPRSGPPVPPPREPDIFRFRFDDQLTREVDANRGEVRLRQELTLEIAEEAFADGDEILVRVEAWFDLFLDSGRVGPRSERVKMEYFAFQDPRTGEVHTADDTEGASRLILPVERGDGAYPIQLQSAPLPNPEYAGRLVIVAEREA